MQVFLGLPRSRPPTGVKIRQYRTLVLDSHKEACKSFDYCVKYALIFNCISLKANFIFYIKFNLSLVQNWQQAITWTNDDPVRICIYMQPQTLNSSPPSAANTRQWTGTALVQVMACGLFGAKPLPEPMLAYCQLDSWKQISVKFESGFYYFHSRKLIWKCRLPEWRPFCPGRDELTSTLFPEPDVPDSPAKRNEGKEQTLFDALGLVKKTSNSRAGSIKSG